MKYKIGIYGTAKISINTQTADKIRKLSEELAHASDKVIIVTGGCEGIPYEIAETTANMGTTVWAFPAYTSKKEMKYAQPNQNLKIYKKINYINPEIANNNSLRTCLKYRNVSSTSACSAGIIVGGKWGSLNEFTNLMDMQKIIGVLTGTGGIADELPSLCRKIQKEGQGKGIFSDDPAILVKSILAELTKNA